VVAALAQYTHTLISNLPMLFLGRLADQTDTGIYTFAFYLSVQATFVISQQVGSVLQPIFVKLRHDPVRQAKSYLRVIAAIGAVAVPLSLLQAALAEPVLLVLFGPKWSSAVPTFIVLSVGQAFFFAVAPTMAMLRAQGRFRALLVWQVVQLLCSAGAYAAAASRGAVPTAIVDTIAWALAIPIAAWVCVRGREAAVADILRALAGPWLSAIPCAAAAWGCWVLLRPSGLEGALVAVVIVGPALAAASLVAMRFTQPATYLELAPMVGRSARSVARLPQAILSRAFSRGA
jgi:O-antigen/teichoic acid export membrane protein